MPVPSPTSTLDTPSHSDLHLERINVKSFGATGDGVADDTAEIQAAINAAAAAGGGQVYFPPGFYIVTSSLTLNSINGAVRLSGAKSMNPDQATTGSSINGSFAGAIFSRTTSVSTAPIVIEDLTVHTNHATGTAFDLEGLESPGGIYRCYIRAHIGIDFSGGSVFEYVVENCRFSRSGNYAGSVGYKGNGHARITNFDLAGYENGIWEGGPASTIQSGRIETSGAGVLGGTASGNLKGTISDINFESCDHAIYLSTAGPLVIQGCSIYGADQAPSGGSINGIYFDSTQSVTVVGVEGSGTFSTAFINIPAAAIREKLTLIGCSGTPWAVTQNAEIQILNCGDVTDVVRVPVVATASLPAAAAAQDGRTIIEDAGAGNRNLILYAGGQRFRIDGGSAV